MNLKQKLLKKLKKSGGFTLIEMLIVVAIIAILVAISIPVVNSSLDKARKATDDANERAAKSAALIRYMSDEDKNAIQDGKDYFYDAANGELKEDKSGIKAYGQTTKDPIHRGQIVSVTFGPKGEVTTGWAPADAAAG